MVETRRLKSKVCLVGEKAVGKTSLIRRFVLNTFDDRYITTIGTKVSKKELEFEGKDMHIRVDMTIWDIMGEKGFRELLKEAYFYGANGILAVSDLTRKKTLVDLDDWIDSTMKEAGKIPVMIALNKVDLEDDAEFGDREAIEIAKAFEAPFIYTSAKTGERVQDAFERLGKMVIESQLGMTL
ncbi:MAG: Rab family GTPase [Thermoplasmata archaeon]